MKANKTQSRALLDMLHRLYEEIRDIEDYWRIQADNGDYRPRIEYFHDAVRAYTKADGQGIEGQGRLSVELLAYDISMLRYIQAHPLPKSHSRNSKLSPKVDVVHNVPRAPDDKSGLKPDASVKYKLADLYKSYAVIFSALLAEAADYNYMTRMNDTSAEIEDLAEFTQHVAQEEGQMDMEDLAQHAVQTQELMQKITAGFKSGNFKKRMSAKDALRALKETQKQIDKQAKDIEKAHFTYATGQLAIYEGSKDVIKKMAIKGFNIIGDFVENAVRDAQRGERDR